MIKKHSIKRAQAESELRKAENELKLDPVNDRCFFFPRDPRSCFDHIVPKSQNTSLIACKENLLPIGLRAHHIITFGSANQIKALPKINEYLLKMKELDESYYNRFLINRGIEL